MGEVTNMGGESTISNSGHLIDYEFLPGVIVETDDPLKYGRIKVSALGAYNANNSKMHQLPWCYPFTMAGNNTYASYEKGSKVWLLRNKKRQDENWFIPMYEHHSMTQEFIDNTPADQKPEVISMRNRGGERSSITYDHGNGYNISSGGVGGGGNLCVKSDSTTMTGGASSVQVKDGSVSLGTEGQTPHPAVLGDLLVKCIEDFIEIMLTFARDIASYVPWAAGASVNFIQSIVQFMQKDEYVNLLSKAVNIYEDTPSEANQKRVNAEIEKAQKEAEAIMAEETAKLKAAADAAATADAENNAGGTSLSVANEQRLSNNGKFDAFPDVSRDLQNRLDYNMQQMVEIMNQNQQPLLYTPQVEEQPKYIPVNPKNEQIGPA